MPQLILLFIGFVAISGLFAMMDTAILSVNPAEVEEMVVQKKYGSLALRKITKHLSRTLIVLVIFTNTVNILGPILVGDTAILLFGNQVIGYVTAILAVTTIIFSEIIPKSLGSHYAPTIARIVAPFFLACTYVLFPIVLVFERLVKTFQTGKRKVGTEEQIRALVDIGEEAGHIEEDEMQLIRRAFVLNDRRARDIMRPRDAIVAIPKSANVRQAADTVFKNSYSRYPLYDASIDNITGLVLSRDILGALAQGKDRAGVETLSQEILYVSATMKSDRLLTLFRDRFIHIAVVQQDKKTVGVVTLEDVLEELVGEIEDEADTRASNDQLPKAKKLRAAQKEERAMSKKLNPKSKKADRK